MGDRMKVMLLAISVIALVSVGIYQESFAATYVKTITIPYYQLNDFLRFNGLANTYEEKNEYQPLDFNSFTPEEKKQINEDVKKSKDKSFTRPTFGISHQDSQGLVRDGFKFNDKAFSIKDNFHTVFAKQPIVLGEVNTFEAKVYAMEKLKVQEFIFGIPERGEAHLGEMGIEVHYDLLGEITEVKIIQSTNVVDPETIVVEHNKAKCLGYESEKKCDSTKVSVVFLEPLKDSVMAIKAIDYKNRFQITYLNDGFDISGKSLNPLPSMMIASPEKFEALVEVTQTEKYSPYWMTEDGRIFEKNKFDSFNQIDIKFERFHDSGDPKNRLHSEFGKVIEYEAMRATEMFDASKLEKDLPGFWKYEFSDSEQRMTSKLQKAMAAEEKRAMEVFNSIVNPAGYLFD